MTWWMAGTAHAQSCEELRLSAAMLDFDVETTNGLPGGWSGYPAGTVFRDSVQKHSGPRSLRLERNDKSAGEFTSVARSLPISFTGKSIELRGWMRAEGGTPRLWMRQDGEKPSLAFVNLDDSAKVTGEWARYSIHFERQPEAQTLIFGISFSGNGRAWADGFELLIDGQPLEGTEPGARESVVSRDHEFDAGSRFSMAQVSDAQLDALVLTGKVWGFLKYHHPAVTAGQRHWDFDLLHKLPMLMAARSPRDVRRLLVEWIDSLGPVPPRSTLADSQELQLQPQLAWLGDRKLLGKDLSEHLKAIYRNRLPGRQNFVCISPNVGSALLGDEPDYAQVKFPDTGFQVLAIYRLWNVVEYWFPYRALIDEDWDDVLRDSLRNAAASMESAAFQREMLALVARVDDGHANLWSSGELREPVGKCVLPVHLRYLQGKFVVKALATDDENARRFKAADVLLSLDGTPVDDIARNARRLYGASNENARMTQIARGLTRGACGNARVEVMRDGVQAIEAQRVPFVPQFTAGWRNDRPGDTFQMLSPEVAYLKLSSIRSAEVAGYIEKARAARALIVDIRNYPSEYVVYSLGTLLVDSKTPFVAFTMPDLSNPGAFHWAASPSLEPQEPHFGGRVAILVDETSMSQAEYTAMALRASPRAIIVGTQTAGADGNIVPIRLPGNLGAAMSGLGVFYPDRRPTQQVGVALDIECPNTIAGLREGRDETLDCALRELAKNP
ncbi:MAG TPA: S41 family peptidase [Steroidobacteraceae bacterium]|nr:S41 family peptidase [Steroidobacteraceae bacterium]